MRVAVEIPYEASGTYGGGIFYTENLLRGLAAVAPGDEFLVFNYCFREHARMVARVPCPPAPNVRKLIKRWPESLVNLLEWDLRLPFIETALRREGVDVLHAVRPPSSARLPFVYIHHDLMHTTHPERMHPGLRWGVEKGTLPGLKLAKRVLVHSEHHKAELVRVLGVAEEKIRVTPSGARCDLFFPVTDSGRLDEARRRLGLPERFLAAIGPFRRWWVRYDTLLEAFARLSPAHPGVGLAMVGDDHTDEAKALRAKAEGLGLGARVLWLGRLPVRDLVSLMSLAVLNAYPAIDSGSSLNVLDCMAAGLPVVAGKVSLLPEMLADAGTWADPASPEDLARAMGELLDDPALRRAKSEEGLKRARARTWEDTARLTLAAYREAAA